MKHHDKKWGYETHIVNTLDNRDLFRALEQGYCLKELTVVPNGQACSIHFHISKTETFYVTSGFVLLELWSAIRPDWLRKGEELTTSDLRKLQKRILRHRTAFKLAAGDTLTIQPLRPHRFWAPRVVAKFLEVSTPDRAEDSYRIVESGPKPKDRCLPAFLRGL